MTIGQKAVLEREIAHLETLAESIKAVMIRMRELEAENERLKAENAEARWLLQMWLRAQERESLNV